MKPNDPRIIRIWYPDNLRNRTVYGDIVYPKSWYGFKHPCGQSSIYAIWRQQIKAYMSAGHLDPGHLTETQVHSIVLFARGLYQQKRTLRLIRQRCALMQATHLLRPMRPVRPDLGCNAPPHATLPDATWQCSLRPDAT